MTLSSFLAHRRFRYAAIAVVVILLALLLLGAAFPFGMLRGTIEQRMSDSVGRPVTIAGIERLDRFSFHPRIAVRGVRIPQPAWAGNGDLAVIDRAEVTLAVLDLLRGKVDPSEMVVKGMRLTLIRDASGRENWRNGPDSDDASTDSSARIERIEIADSVIAYTDAKRGRSATVRLAASQRDGLRATGSGSIGGRPVRVAFTGGRIVPGARWPFRARIEGQTLSLDAAGTMDGPLTTNHMRFALTTRADDLKTIDAVIEAGLFGTQPVAMRAQVVRDGSDWSITDMAGTIGGSDLTGRLQVRKRDGRTKLDGQVTFGSLDFADLATDAGLARGRAKAAATGPRMVPDTRVNIKKIDRTDGTIAFTVRAFRSRAPSSLRSASGTMTLDHQLLTLSPLNIRMGNGQASGRIIVDQRGGKPRPAVTVDMTMTGASLAAVAAANGSVTGTVSARINVTGTGDTLREAIGRSDGAMGFVIRDGMLPARESALLGFDAGRAMVTGKDEDTALRCVVIRLMVRGGTGRLDPMVIDTGNSQLTGTGTVRFPDEILAIRLTGAPKRESLLRLPGSATLTGSIYDPDFAIPKEVKSVGNIFKAIGRAIRGKQGALATDADCGGLAARAMQ